MLTNISENSDPHLMRKVTLENHHILEYLVKVIAKNVMFVHDVDIDIQITDYLDCAF